MHKAGVSNNLQDNPRWRLEQYVRAAPAHGLEDHEFGLPRRVSGWCDHAQTEEFVGFLCFRLGREGWVCRCVYRRITNSACLDE